MLARSRYVILVMAIPFLLLSCSRGSTSESATTVSSEEAFNKGKWCTAARGLATSLRDFDDALDEGGAALDSYESGNGGLDAASDATAAARESSSLASGYLSVLRKTPAPEEISAEWGTLIDADPDSVVSSERAAFSEAAVAITAYIRVECDTELDIFEAMGRVDSTED